MVILVCRENHCCNMVILVCRPCGECNWITMDDYREDQLTERVSYQTFVIGATESGEAGVLYQRDAWRTI